MLWTPIVNQLVGIWTQLRDTHWGGSGYLLDSACIFWCSHCPCGGKGRADFTNCWGPRVCLTRDSASTDRPTHAELLPDETQVTPIPCLTLFFANTIIVGFQTCCFGRYSLARNDASTEAKPDGKVSGWSSCLKIIQPQMEVVPP